jgi:hypothetical protein
MKIYKSRVAPQFMLSEKNQLKTSYELFSWEQYIVFRYASEVS